MASIPLVVPYEVDGRRERLVYLSREGDLAAYEELRSGFTAAVSHELRTPLARLLTLLETATLPGEDMTELVEQATSEVEQITELIDEVLFLSELESGARVVALGAEPVRPVLEEALDELEERAERAGVELRLECDPAIELAIRPRMLRVVARNLAENAIRYAGPGATFTLDVERQPDGVVVLAGRDDGIGVEEAELPRLFERFYRVRSGARLAGNGTRACDREARRDPSRRERRGTRRSGGASRSGVSSRHLCSVHRTFTVSSPSGIPEAGSRPGD